jgi:hypothetical protein
MNAKELNVRELPTFPNVQLTGELGIVFSRENQRWERNGQQLIGPLSKLILDAQPPAESWIAAASHVTGWGELRVFAFQTALSAFRITGGFNASDATNKGVTDAALYGLLYKLARKTNYA